MDRFQYWWLSLENHATRELEQTATEQSDQEESPTRQESPTQDEPATVKAASAISEGILRHSLTAREKEIAGPLVHYAVGTTAGAVYGVVAEYQSEVTSLSGMPFGAAFWLVVDEGSLPVLGLAKGPTAYPVGIHVYALASHLVFGLTAEVVRRTVRRAL
jgi:putative membrane protein